MPTKEEIIAGLSKSMRQSYRTLMASAAKQEKVLIWVGGIGFDDLEVVDQPIGDNQVVLYDGRKTVTA
ncbi:MAG: hypothetical protein M0R80_23705 [Proteobacteria bacterium]|jgi:activator of 2-hydroxyglutaryl-CoA dehydratase|nr:hypothetical protein [Pseudomonadota bacterium]